MNSNYPVTQFCCLKTEVTQLQMLIKLNNKGLNSMLRSTVLHYYKACASRRERIIATKHSPATYILVRKEMKIKRG